MVDIKVIIWNFNGKIKAAINFVNKYHDTR